MKDRILKIILAPGKDNTLSFLLSFTAAFSLTQDYMGKEKYLEYISKHWIDSSITVPLALLILSWVLATKLYNFNK